MMLRMFPCYHVVTITFICENNTNETRPKPAHYVIDPHMNWKKNRAWKVAPEKDTEAIV